MNPKTSIQSVAAWLEVSPEELREIFNGKTDSELCELESSLSFSHPRKERLMRKYIGPLLDKMPYALYRPVTDILKRARGGSSTKKDIHFEPGPLMKLLEETKIKKSGWTTVCLTHDVDTADCSEFAGEVARIEETCGIRSAFNVLTKGPYELDLGWLDELESGGFEIGLHGDYHDLAIGFRRKSVISDRLKSCLDRIGRPVAGYRAPALSISPTLLQVLGELGFRYDSSIKMRLYYSDGISSCIPYLYPGTSMWEFPLTVQDDGLFRDQDLSDDQALEVVKEIIEKITPFSGMVVINTHPCHIRDHLRFYKSLVEYLAGADKLNIMLGRDLAGELDKTANTESAP